ncbi:hypothetical protein [Alcanivorax sp. 1008]|uniref:hypothetical protein n=1 Tax=Alcanivorax sp. 1008 TaxID=2816853 RepID=UPI001D2D0709|nr:hypothetical protein [Alcanivorax sp. 1008]MCC1496974.1 hypothetical protein [Alcanivorax sp. 1008]
MNKIAALTTALLFSAISFAGGVFYGFKEGIRNLSLLEEIVQGALSRHQLASIEKDKIENVVHLFELNIDIGLHRYMMYRKSGNKLLSEFFLPEVTSNLDGYVELMAAYRKEHPIVFGPEWALPVDGDDEETRKWREQGYSESVEMLSEIKELLRSRGVPESALTNQSTRTQ